MLACGGCDLGVAFLADILHIRLSMLLILGLWCFTQVVLDCHGGPETMGSYIQKAHVAIPIWGTCTDPDTLLDYPCITGYTHGPWVDYGSTTHVQDAAEQCAIDFVPNPACLDCVMFVDMIAVDAAGNRSDQVCP